MTAIITYQFEELPVAFATTNTGALIACGMMDGEADISADDGEDFIIDRIRLHGHCKQSGVSPKLWGHAEIEIERHNPIFQIICDALIGTCSDHIYDKLRDAGYSCPSDFEEHHLDARQLGVGAYNRI